MYKQPEVYSSYAENNLGKTLYDAVLEYKPKKIIDFGVLEGYSTISMAQALRDLSNGGKVIAYDLFEDYPYRHSAMSKTKENINKYNLSEFVTLKRKNFYDWIKNPEDFDLMHLDISNDGEIIKLAYNNLKKYLDKGSVLIFEGGTKDRDQVEWMIKYNKTPIYPLKKEIGYKILDERFPGLAILASTSR